MNTKKMITGVAILLMGATSLHAIDSNITVGIQEKYTNTFKHSPLYLSINVWQDYKDFQAYAQYTNEMSKVHSIYFNPSQDYYTVGVKYIKENVSIKLEHQCSHPVVPYHMYNGVDTSYTKFEITIGKSQR